MPVKKTILLIFIYLFNSTSSIICQENIDYLKKAGNIYQTDIDSAIFYLEQGNIHFKKTKDWEKYINCLNGLSSCFNLKGEFSKSQFYAFKANKEAKLYLDKSHIAYGAAISNFAFFSQEKGDYQQAINLYKETLKIEELNDDKSLQITSLNNIAFCYFKSGEFAESEKFYTKSINLSKQYLHPGNGNRLLASIGLANIYNVKNKQDQALKIYNFVLSQYNKHPSKEQTISAKILLDVNFKIAQILMSKNAKKEFDQNLKEMDLIHKSTFNRPSTDKHILSGKWALRNNQYQEALKEYNIALQLEKESIKNLKHSTKIGNIYLEISKVFIEIKEYDRALEYLKNSMENFNMTDENSKDEFMDNSVLNLDALDIISTKAGTHYNIYINDNTKSKLEEAEEFYTYSILLLNKIRLSYLNKESKENLLSKAVLIFEGMLNVLKIRHEENPTPNLLSQIYEVFENSKAVILLESIRENNALGAAGIPDTLIKKDHDLKLNINYHKEQLSLIPSSDSTKSKTVNANLFNLEKEHRDLIDIFETQYPKYYELKYNDNFNTLADGKKLISNDQTALLNYFVGDEHIYILSITKDKTKFKRVVKPENFYSQIEDLRDIITNPPSSKNSKQEFEKFQNGAFNLYELLIAPAELTPSIDQLIIVPDDVLAYIPFEILLSRKQNSNTINYKSSYLDYLVKEYQITYLYSTSLLKDDLRKNRNKNKDIIGFAPSFNNEKNESDSKTNCSLESLAELACNSFEAESVAGLFEGKAFVGLEASTDKFNSNIKDYRIAHFATHSCLNDDDPMLNRIFFADGYISNYDLYNLDLNNEMAVLSACNTGSGVLKRGEGVMSLSRGFIHAGCPSVLMSLWSVEDCTTTDIMVNFYQKLKKGESKDLALKNAKLNYLNQANKLQSHPFYWAPFVHIGDVDPIRFSSDFNYWLYGILILILLVVIILLMRKFR